MADKRVPPRRKDETSWLSHHSGRVTGKGVVPGEGDAEAGTMEPTRGEDWQAASDGPPASADQDPDRGPGRTSAEREPSGLPQENDDESAATDPRRPDCSSN